MQAAFEFNATPSTNLMKKPSTMQLVKTLKQEDQDFEFYPTTDEIMQCIEADLQLCFTEYKHDKKFSGSVIDCGAGDGRVLTQLTSGEKFAIEKSSVLRQSMPSDVVVIGTDFNHQTLLDKKADVLFSNPPYKQFRNWFEKIVNESNVKLAYLVVPERWKNDKSLELALLKRRATAEVIGEFSFENAERKARANVHVLKIAFYKAVVEGFSTKIHISADKGEVEVDPFGLWFEEHFTLGESYEQALTEKSTERQLDDRLTNQLVKDEGLIKNLETFYNQDMAELIDNYQKLESISANLLVEFGFNIENVKAGLKCKINNLKDLYWAKLFEYFTPITSRLCKAQRESIRDKINDNMSVDFNAANALAIVEWVVKNANAYIDEQFIETYKKMLAIANVKSYKSNQKTFEAEGWKYKSFSRAEIKASMHHVKLEHRVVLENQGGLCASICSIDAENGLSINAKEFIDDLLVVAYNLGFNTTDTLKSTDGARGDWGKNNKQVFSVDNLTTGKTETVFEVKAFKNGNLHVKFNSKFMCKMNVRFGQLQGWVKSREQAAEDLEETMDMINECYDAQFTIKLDNLPKLTVS